MADALLVRERAELGERAGEALRAEGLPVLATYWDFSEDADEWFLRVVLAGAMPSREFIERTVKMRRAGELPESISAGDLSPVFAPDAAAAALVRYRRDLNKSLVHVKRAVLDGVFFDEAVLGYVAPEYEPGVYVARATA